MPKYTPITAREAADALGLWDDRDGDWIPGEELAAAMLSGDEPFEAAELAKIAARVGLSVDELTTRDGRFERYADPVLRARRDIARRLVADKMDEEYAAEVCGLAADDLKKALR